MSVHRWQGDLPLLNCTIAADVDDVAYVVLSQVGTEGDRALLAMLPAEGILRDM